MSTMAEELLDVVSVSEDMVAGAVVERDMVTKIVAEASELGLAPNWWPKAMRVHFPKVTEPIIFSRKRLNYVGLGEDMEISDAVYASEDLSLRLVVLND